MYFLSDFSSLDYPDSSSKSTGNGIHTPSPHYKSVELSPLDAGKLMAEVRASAQKPSTQSARPIDKDSFFGTPEYIKPLSQSN